jgi:hypothetical protein
MATTIDGRVKGLGQAGGSGATIVRAIGGKTASLAIDTGGSRIARRIVEHTAIGIVGDVEVVVAVESESSGIIEAGSTDGIGGATGVVDTVGGKTAILSIDDASGEVARRIGEDAIVATVSDIEGATTIEDDPEWISDTGGTDGIGGATGVIEQPGRVIVILPIDARGDDTPRGIIEDAVVVPIGDIEIATTVQSDTVWLIEAGGTGTPIIAGVGGVAAALPINAGRGGTGSGIVEDAVVAIVSDIKVATTVQSKASGTIEVIGTGSASNATAIVIDDGGGKAAALPIDAGSGGAASGIVEDAVVCVVSDIEVPTTIKGDISRTAETGGAGPAIIGSARGKDAALTIDRDSFGANSYGRGTISVVDPHNSISEQKQDK